MFLDQLKNENNLTTGWNGETGYKSTLNDVLDFYAKAGNMRNSSSPSDVISAFEKAFVADQKLAMRLLFYTRDIRQGMGEKRISLNIFEHFAANKPKLFKKMIPLIAYYGSFNDLRKLLGSEKLSITQLIPVILYLKDTLAIDVDKMQSGESITLCAKWMPTVGNKSKLHKLALQRFLSQTGIKEKEYRQSISAMRKYIDILETKMTNKDYASIDYSKVPSQAFKKFKNAFARNDEERFKQFIEDANNGEVTINASTIHVNQLISEYTNYSSKEDAKVEAQWKNLPKIQSDMNVLPVVDMSGSMTWASNPSPYEVAISLGLYLAENNSGTFADHVLTFASNPELVHVPKEMSLFNRYYTLKRAKVGYSTDLEKTFDLILNTAVKNNTPQEELPQAIIVFTDGQMNQMVDDRSIDQSFFNKIKNKFKAQGYELPHLIWWNIAAVNSNALPVTKNDKNCSLISGYSQALFNYIFQLDLDKLQSFTPMNLMLETLNNERYDLVDKYMEE